MFHGVSCNFVKTLTLYTVHYVALTDERFEPRVIMTRYGSKLNSFHALNVDPQRQHWLKSVK